MNLLKLQDVYSGGKKKNSVQSTLKIEIEKASSFENSGNISEELFGIKTSDINRSSEPYYIQYL